MGGASERPAMQMPTKKNPESSMMRRNREVQILAKSIYRDMTSQGFDKSDIVNLATALLDQLTTRMGEEGNQRD
jgi:hypothetical protein